MDSSLAMEVTDVSKRFRLYHEKKQSLKERVIRAGHNGYEDFWALRNVSFDVAEGETVGILGRNGSGKSTLLKCMSGILQPTNGRVVVRGKLAALLELGAGFQPELSGRDNVFLNGSLLGLSTREMEQRFDDIVAFAELEHFIDNQVKFYSSGMYIRLGFAVAVNVDPDILVVDEVLAVGDENFQLKCIDRIKLFQREGRTIVFVTHAADQVRQICDRAIVLRGGEILDIGTPGEAIRAFREHLVEVEATGELMGESASDRAPGGAPGTEAAPVYRPIVITAVDVEHPGSGSRQYLVPGEALTVRVSYDALEPIDVVMWIAVHDVQGNLVFGSDTDILGQRLDSLMGSGRLDFVFDSVPLLDGTYSISVGIRSLSGGTVYDLSDHEHGFEVMNPGRSIGVVALPLRAEVAAPAGS